MIMPISALVINEINKIIMVAILLV